MEFSGKTAVVTGASSGIGQATARLLASQGARVVVHYHANREGAVETVESIQNRGGTARAIQADLTTRAGVKHLQQETHSTLGPVDILVNNAGTLVQRCAIREMSDELFEQILSLNFTSLFRVTRAFLEDMISQKKGVIVNMSSIAARNGGGAGAGVYAASKAAALCLTKAMAREFLPYGIRVNGVNPGVIQTPFHDRFTPPELMQRFTEMIPLQRPGTPEEVAEVIVFLASDRSSYLVGEHIEINGGLLMD